VSNALSGVLDLRPEGMVFRHSGGHRLNNGTVPVTRVGVFVVDGHDIDFYPDAHGAAREIEGYDAVGLEYFGADGDVYLATVEGSELGSVTLHRTQNNRLDELVCVLRSEAAHRGLSLAPETADDPAAIWNALLAAQQKQRERHRSQRRGRRKRRVPEVPPEE